MVSSLERQSKGSDAIVATWLQSKWNQLRRAGHSAWRTVTSEYIQMSTDVPSLQSTTWERDQTELSHCCQIHPDVTSLPSTRSTRKGLNKTSLGIKNNRNSQLLRFVLLFTRLECLFDLSHRLLVARTGSVGWWHALPIMMIGGVWWNRWIYKKNKRIMIIINNANNDQWCLMQPLDYCLSIANQILSKLVSTNVYFGSCE